MSETESHQHRMNVETEEHRHRVEAASEDRRNRSEGFYFTGKQFAGLMAAILSAQVTVNWWAAKSFVKEVAIEVVRAHNTDPDSHARALLIAQQERLDMVRQIVVLQTKIDGLEQMIRTLAAQGAFDVVPNGNGKKNGNGR